MSTANLTPARANLELTLLNAEVEAMSTSDFYAWLKERGVPDEVAIRIKGVAEVTAEVGGRVVNVGKMILLKIMEFVKANPKMAVGIAIGAAIGALVNAIPWIGTFLSPIATLIAVGVGAWVGHLGDRDEKGLPLNTSFVAISQDFIEIATLFFKLLIDIFNLTLNGLVLKNV